MAKKQLAKAALDRIKRSAKDGYPKKKPKNKFKVISSKTVSKGKDYAKNVVTSPSKLKVKGPKESSKPFVRGAIAGGATVGLASGAGKKQSKAKESTTKRMADDAYKKQKEKQKKYYDKKTESKRK
jgi:hypothetical protein